ncbi:unnamed protein product [Spirodela intermedia]|uniref:Uncharacterized protein n=1 Tax=Spirodela intermedia TaxID=51605 RepID=A0ABN7E8T9_SPIIN|nr:unnamed protein product [Spirodela intermedia]
MRRRCTGILSIRGGSELLKDNRVHHRVTTPYHPQTMARSFILRSTQQEEALHHIWYALKRCKASPIDRRTSHRREEDNPPKIIRHLLRAYQMR